MRTATRAIPRARRSRLSQRRAARVIGSAALLFALGSPLFSAAPAQGRLPAPLTLKPAPAAATTTAEPPRELRVASLRELRDRGVVRQQRDYSCGAAALATLLTHGLGDPVDEETVLRAVIEPMSEEQLASLQKDGLSLRHLQLVADDRGFNARGFRLRADQLMKLQRPVIVFIRPGGYPHFAVLKGVRNGRAHVADPSLGNVRMPLTRFVEQWVDPADPAGRGVIFAVERQDGSWPREYPLQIDAGPPQPLEATSMLRLTDRTLPAALAAPAR